MFPNSEIGSDVASINLKNIQPRSSLEPQSVCLLRFFCSVIPIFTLKTAGLRNEGPYVDKSQKIWKPTSLFTYLDLVRVCRFKHQVALKLENNLRF